jgi:hypothetical protein
MLLRLAWIVVFFAPVAALAAEKPAVVELFEDDADGLIAQLTMGGISGQEQVGAGADKDAFTGKVSLRVGAAQRFSPVIKDWDFPIEEKPKPGEYRYLRFAWKKAEGGGPIMLQFHTRRPNPDWNIRYYMGADSPPWASKVLAQGAPTEWQVVTCDMFKDFGAVSLSGVAFTPYTGGDGLFDHILLGRSVADLDKATAAAILQMPSKRIGEVRLRQLLEQLGAIDDPTGSTAIWALVASRDDAVPFLLKNVVVPERKAPRPVDKAKVKPLIDDLGHFRHVNREAAEKELIRLGDGVLPHLRKAVGSADGEKKVRLKMVLDRWESRAGLDELWLGRCATALRAINADETKELLAKIEKALP